MNTSGGWQTTYHTYDDLGNLRWTTQPDGQNSTVFSYSDNWWSNTACVPAGWNTQAYVTQVTNALNQPSISHFYPCTGQLAHSRDPNDIANSRNGTVRSYDLMNRISQIDHPDGGQTKFAYDDTVGGSTPWVRQDTLLKADGSGNPGTCLGDKWASSWTQFDGLGRVKRTAKCNGLPVGSSHNDQVDTCYDLLGRKSFVSYPFQGPGFTPESYLCVNSTQRPGDTFTYDPLSRPLQVTNSDGGILDTVYFSGHVRTIFDQAGKKRFLQEDGLGRLIFIQEPDAAGSFVNWTRYFYDPLDNLTRVEQQGADHVNQANWRIRTFQYDSLSRLTSATNPESGTITFGYDINSNLISKTAPAPNQIGSATVGTSYFYDGLNRLTTRCFTSGGCAGVMYDLTNVWGLNISNSIGRVVLTDTSAHNANTLTSYDPMGRPVFQVQTRTGAPSQRFDYEYNVDGSLKSLTYPSTRKLDYTYNIGQRATSMVDTANSINYATDAAYTAWGAAASYKNGKTASFTGITTTNDYNSRMQPVFLSATKPAGTVMSLGYDFHLGAGNNGNVFQITNNLNNDRTQIFTYDELNRISTAKTQATTGEYCWGETFGYDIWANLTSRGVLTGYTGCTGEGPVPAATVKNQMATHTYDAAGNHWPTGYSYSAENMLVAAPGSMSFEYDADLRRVKKSNGSTGTLYWYGSGGEVLQETDLAGVLKREFIYFNGKRTARRDAPSGNVFYYFSDHLGSSNVVTSADGTIKEESDFYPFGGERVITNLLPDQDYKFTGKERDSETNLDYFGARYYAYNFGRFTTPDQGPLLTANPQSLNRYSYAFNNPLRYIDPDGNLATDIHMHITNQVLGEMGYSRVVGNDVAFHNARVDDLYNDKAHAHMHSQDGADNPDPIAARNKSLSFIKQSRIGGAEAVLSGDFGKAREYLGQLLHAAQDEKHDYQPFDKHKGSAGDVLNPEGRKQAASDLFPSKEQLDDARRRTREEVRRFESRVMAIGVQQGMRQIQIELQLHLFRISEKSEGQKP